MRVLLRDSVKNLASMTLETQQEYQRCVNCIMDTTDPLIEFNEDGVCNHCIKYQYYEQNYMLRGKEAQKQIDEMVAEIKRDGKNKEYDCIMGLSGGVDSSYLAYYASKVLGLRILVVHVDSGWNSELAVNNIENIIKVLELDLHTLVLDWNEIRDLQRAFFKSSVPNCDIPQDHAFIASLYTEAKKFNLKHILNGGNMATESILPDAWGYDDSDLIHLKDIHKKYGEIKLEAYPMISFFQKKIMFPMIYGLKVHRPLEYIDYNKEKVKRFLIEELGWRDYGGKHYESSFTKFFQSYYLPEKYGFDKRLAHYSSLIVSGQMTRKEAIEKISEPLYEPKEMEQDREFFIKKLGFSRFEWDHIMEMEPKSEHDFKNELKLALLFRITRYAISLPLRAVRKIYNKILKLFNI